MNEDGAYQGARNETSGNMVHQPRQGQRLPKDAVTFLNEKCRKQEARRIPRPVALSPQTTMR